MQKFDIVPGIQSVRTLLHATPERVLELFVEDGVQNDRIQDIADHCKRQSISVQTIQKERLTRLCEGVHHQGIAARCTHKPDLSDADLKPIIENATNPLLLALDEVTDPHNLGACLRSAEAARVDAVIIPEHNSALISPAVRKVSCGASELIPFVRVKNLARAIERVKELGVWVTGTCAESELTLYDCDLTRPTLLVLGAEGSGLRRLTREHCDFLAQLPMGGYVESLNVSVSAGICLFEAVRQRRAVATI